MNKRGFTLIELLVVITIIGLLVGLTVPAVSKALDRAKDAKSASNLRQIGMGLNNFANDHDNLYPLAGGTILYKESPSDTDVLSWTQQLEDYLGKDKSIYKNPKVKNRDYGYYIGARAAYVAASNHFAPMNKLLIKEQTKHILGGESLYFTFTEHDADPDDFTTQPSFEFFDGTIQKKRSQVLFVDGHVESLDRFNTDQITTRYEGIGSPY